MENRNSRPKASRTPDAPRRSAAQSRPAADEYTGSYSDAYAGDYGDGYAEDYADTYADGYADYAADSADGYDAQYDYTDDYALPEEDGYADYAPDGQYAPARREGSRAVSHAPRDSYAFGRSSSPKPSRQGSKVRAGKPGAKASPKAAARSGASSNGASRSGGARSTPTRSAAPQGARQGTRSTQSARPAPAKAPKQKKEVSRGSLAAVIVVTVLLLLILGGVAAAMVYVGRIDTIYPGVSVNGTDLSGMTEQQALSVLSGKEKSAYDGYSVTVALPMDNSLTVTAEDAGIQLDATAAAEAAWNYGRSGNKLADLISYVRCAYLDEQVPLSAEASRTMDTAAVRAMVDEVAARVNEELLSSEMKVGQYSINIVKGAQAFYIDEDAIMEVLEDAILKADPTPIVYEAEMKTDEEMDLDALYEELHCEAISSYYDPETKCATPSQVGVTFNLAEAKKTWSAAEYGETVAIRLERTEPEVSEEELNSMLFRDLLGEKTTSLTGSTANRISNVSKACELLSAVIMEPGDEFDYNSTLGQRNEQNGWLPAPAYADGEVRDEYGGGICQVSSTLFVSCLLADLEIVDRSCHYFPVGYLTAGMDATVSWGGPEYKFKNNRDLPIRLKAFVSDDQRTVTVQIWGTNVDGTHVKINYSGAMEDFDDPSLCNSAGEPVATGYTATIWCHVMNADGTIVKGEGNDYHWFISKYHYHTEDIQAKVAS